MSNLQQVVYKLEITKENSDTETINIIDIDEAINKYYTIKSLIGDSSIIDVKLYVKNTSYLQLTEDQFPIKNIKID